MRSGKNANRLVAGFNRGVIALMASGPVGSLLRRRLVTISYVGRRSGRSFTIPVEHQRVGDQVTIGVQMADAKNWWRNFVDEGGPITLHFHDGDRTGHAAARREGPKAVVTVQLNP